MLIENDHPLSQVKVRSNFRSIFDKERRFEKVIKFYLDRNREQFGHNATYNYIAKKYPNIPSEVEVSQLLSDLKTNNEYPDNLIYQYWHQGCTPQKAIANGSKPWHPVHKMSALSVDKYEGDRHIILDYDSIHDYVNIPSKLVQLLEKNNRLPLLADFIRSMLLFVNGGIWCDLTMVLFNKIPDYVYENDLFFYVRDNKPKDYKEFLYFDKGTFRWEKDYKVRITPGFIYATRHNILMGKLLFKFLEVVLGERNNLNSLSYYVYMIIFDYLVRNDRDFAEMYKDLSKYPSDVLMHYLVVYCSTRYSDDEYNKIKQDIPIQRIKLSTRFFKGCLAYECLKKEGY